jgi:hypothetical protein
VAATLLCARVICCRVSFCGLTNRVRNESDVCAAPLMGLRVGRAACVCVWAAVGRGREGSVPGAA